MKKKIEHANEENKKLFNWLTKTKAGINILSSVKTPSELRKACYKHAKANGTIAGMPYTETDELTDDGLNWVTFTDLFNTLEIKAETYFSVRTVTATSQEQAIDKVVNEKFDTRHPLCDKALTKTQLLDALKEKTKSRYFLFGERNVDIFMNEGMRNLKRHVQSGETAYTHEQKPDDDLTTLLEAMNGCFDYAELTKKEYETINNF